MSIKKTNRRVLSLLLAVGLVLSSIGTAFGAAAASDIKGHWAENQINSWLEQGFVKGFEDGTFKPNKTISRAEFVALVNRSFGFTEKTEVTFTDMKESNWSYSEVQIAVKAGYITGYTNNTFGPNDEITREQIAAIVTKLLNLKASSSYTSSFKDEATIAAWSKPAVAAVAENKIMSGYNQAFNPTHSATRAEALVVLDNAGKLRVTTTTFDKEGTYGPETGSQVINGNVTITAAGVTLQNTVINGDLVLDKGIGEGDAFLKNVTVKGNTTVKGGGANSIHFEDSILLTVIVDKATGTVRIVAEGTTTIASVVVQSPATLEEADLTGTGFTAVELSKLLPKDSLVTLIGSFESLNIVGAQIKVDIPSGSVDKATVAASAEGVSVNLSKEAKIISLILEAAAKFLGAGTIDSATLSELAKDTTFETKPSKLEGATPTTPPVTGGGGWGGGGGTTTPPTDQQAPVISNDAEMTVDNQGLTLLFSFNEQIDLGTSANVEIKYFQQTHAGLLPLKNKTAGTDLVKNKTWDGYLYGMENGVSYSKGTANIAANQNVISANTKLGSLVKQGHHGVDGDMDYVTIDWNAPATYVAQIVVTDNVGNRSAVKEVTATVPVIDDEVAPVINNATLSVSPETGLLLQFDINESIDFDTDANVEIKYFTKDANDDLHPISNSIAGGALVKNKDWDGYLYGMETGKNYSKGLKLNSQYLNIIPAETKLGTLVKQGYHTDSTDMDYVTIDWHTAATYVAQIIVTDNAGHESVVEEVEAAVPGPVISNASLSVDDQGLTLLFSANEEIDFATQANVVIKYFKKTGSGLQPLLNTTTDLDLIKDKSWDGYLYDMVTNTNYSKGNDPNSTYLNVIPANAQLGTLVKQAHHGVDGDMNYVDIDWTTPATYVAQIVVTNNAGFKSVVKEVEATVSDVVIP
ncbi:S-layer homology domain-containing protein [Paenibacillus mendelii]|uniref:S-layer homology domain-containing protein n=1 Tax=Paenibacillus mendelii TaxID=206163 RepID=A0ABV6J901_9BACL|nr:S-layer homology domain-containing protein [Paenibacillus mendelii]MCQ6561398.1 S-layer homology domain-containing protein [Paenibacillus mendelii]